MKINKNTENVVNMTIDHGSSVKSDQRNGASSSSPFDRSSHECCRECSRASEKETIVGDLVALDSLRKTSENHRRQRLTIDRSDGRGSSPALILIDKDNNWNSKSMIALLPLSYRLEKWAIIVSRIEVANIELQQMWRPCTVLYCDSEISRST